LEALITRLKQVITSKRAAVRGVNLFHLRILIVTNCADPAFFPGRAATIYYRAPPASHSTLPSIKKDIKAALYTHNDIEIGTLGILHPSVLENFEISYPCSALEFNLEPFKKEMQSVWTDPE
jgi:phenylalanyl-tRNA synthetase beta chain